MTAKTGGTFCKFRRGTTGKSGTHMKYISRDSAVRNDERDLLMRNLPDYVREAQSYDELRLNLISYALMREEAARARDLLRQQTRSHFRATLSFERQLEAEQARRMVDEWLERCFPQARAAAFFHRDTEHLHAHIWIEARQLDERKIDLAPREYRRLDERWNEIYAREMNRDEREHLFKKEQTREYKRALARNEHSERPVRMSRKSRDDYDEIERQSFGAREHDESGNRRDQRAVAENHPRLTEGESPTTQRDEELERFLASLNRADQQAERAVQLTRELRDEVARMAEREQQRQHKKEIER
jgi:hypothetical protein